MQRTFEIQFEIDESYTMCENWKKVHFQQYFEIRTNQVVVVREQIKKFALDMNI